MSDSQFVRLDPSTIKIGANVRTDLHADAKEFARSIKERGVLEPVTVYRDEDGAYVVLRGQRRTVVAAEVGLPDIPAQVVAKPDEADRITDQMVENLHRAAHARRRDRQRRRAARARRHQRCPDRQAGRTPPRAGQRRPVCGRQGADPRPGRRR